ncbi:MAG: hypothetical protein WCJ30_03555 [Deltaproteobacteria bacterium]
MGQQASVLFDALGSLDAEDRTAVRSFALRVEALGDAQAAGDLCGRSRAVRAAVGQLRAEALTVLLARDERDEFIRRASDADYMSPVEIESLRVPRYVAVDRHDCACGAALMIPYDKQGGPEYPFDCPACSSPFLARPVYQSGEYRIAVAQDLRPAKKRKKKHSTG